MPVAPTYPGVYIEELPSAVRTITAVGTSVAAFLGYTRRGPVNEAVTITSFADYERRFGGLDPRSPVSYAVQQFYRNGGATAVLVRVVATGTAGSAKLEVPSAGGNTAFTITARQPGTWANGTRISVDHDTPYPESTFNLTVTSPSGARESFTDLAMDSTRRRSADQVVNAASTLISLELPADQGAADEQGYAAGGAFEMKALDEQHRRIAIQVDENDGPQDIEIYDGLPANKPGDAAAVAAAIQSKLRAAGPGNVAYEQLTCTVDNNGLKITSGKKGVGSFVRVGRAGSFDASRALKFGPADGGTVVDALASLRPATNGTVWEPLPDPLPAFAQKRGMEVTIGGDGPHQVTLFDPGDGGRGDVAPTSPAELAALLQRKLRTVVPKMPGSQAFTGVTVKAIGRRLQTTSAAVDPAATIKMSGEGIDDLKLAASVAVAAHVLGTAGSGGGGSDGDPPKATDFAGDESARTGLQALRGLDDVNIVCMPEVAGYGIDDMILAHSAALELCRRQRMFLIVDSPAHWTSLDTARTEVPQLDSLRSSYAAMYFPQVNMPDPVTGQLRSFPPSGVVAGIMARTDTERGVWKAPAGTEARINGARSMTVPLSDPENGLLNPIGVNCLRSFPVVGPVVWGARTLEGADVLASQWKYVPVRRLALMLEESLFRGTKWVVFEPNDERLWSQIRLNIGAFMNTLFRQGAFQGTAAREAYFVKCDKETTTQDDINRGIVNIVVGFAPLKPAEFVIIKIEQMTGQIET